MTRKYFGTDGIRGTANKLPMTAEIALQVGKAAGKKFAGRGNFRHRVVIGKDTRLSGYMIEPALTAGFISVGMDVILVGPLPTPAIAMLTRSLRADLGVMISASHNPYEDNGIKLFGPDGYKLSDDVELEIEAGIENPDLVEVATPKLLGRATRLDDAPGRYIEFAKGSFPKNQLLKGLKIVVDCANGAAYKVAPTVLWELEADVISLGVSPNGFNINDGCGSTSTDAMCQKVVETGAHLGIALDGDADRLIMCDENGHLIDGDQLMALIAASWAERDLLKGGGLVATVMSNMGLEKFLKGKGLDLVRTAVGDRYVVEHMRNHGYNLGGEQSGHMVMSDFATTGDGLVAALQVLSVIVEQQKPVSEIARSFEPFPQILKNVRYGSTDPLSLASVQSAIKNGEEKLASTGRLLIRKSGTEPLIRVMGEGEDTDLVNQVVDDIVEEVQKAAS
ncbi:phosphoglucosamine mutase [Sneathiella limimaris]|uniref:phosphoglucosamine mutase n=1 Tax=Sneathiella limimaris TaxID=1964213 RepID=UPI00146D26E4|nr:phosphoglucosamine mutase [Sneathiella limimaris]